MAERTEARVLPQTAAFVQREADAHLVQRRTGLQLLPLTLEPCRGLVTAKVDA
jgi:hypothetical protein